VSCIICRRCCFLPVLLVCVITRYLCYFCIFLLYVSCLCLLSWFWIGVKRSWVLGCRGIFKVHWGRCGRGQWFRRHWLHVVSCRKCLLGLLMVLELNFRHFWIRFGLATISRGKECRWQVLGSFLVPILPWRAFQWRRRVRFWVPFSK
jgi:hypothetical protein